MNILITAGNTQSPIDRVRCVTNVFSGRTGARLAACAWSRGHRVTLATSNPDAKPDVPVNNENRLQVIQYRTFDELAEFLQASIRTGEYDCIVHTAAVSDYLVAGAYVPADKTFFNARTGEWENKRNVPSMVERDPNGKMKSTDPEMWVRMVRAPKLVDRFRNPWGFGGLIAKFKLEVGISDAELVDVAEASRRQSAADVMVANTLEAAPRWAYLGPVAGKYERIPRRELPERLLLHLEDLKRQMPGGGS